MAWVHFPAIDTAGVPIEGYVWSFNQ